MEEEIKKLYYSIREVADMLGEKQYVLRYWETEFDTLHPKKNRAGNRVYTEEDIEALKVVQRLLRDDKYTIEGARQVLARTDPRKSKPAGLRGSREELLEVRVFLEKLLERL